MPSLAKTAVASGVCLPWPQSTFRFAIATGGDTLTINAAGDSPVLQQAPLAAGEACAGANDPRVPDAAVTGRFYRALGRLAESLGGPRRLCGGPRQ
jgi:hypothetical protein